MFDGLIDKALEKAIPKQLDLGNFDKALNWLRDCAFSAYDLNLSYGKLRELLSSWLDFISEADDLESYHIKALEAYARVIFNDLTDRDFDFTKEV